MIAWIYRQRVFIASLLFALPAAATGWFTLVDPIRFSGDAGNCTPGLLRDALAAVRVSGRRVGGRRCSSGASSLLWVFIFSLFWDLPGSGWLGSLARLLFSAVTGWLWFCLITQLEVRRLLPSPDSCLAGALDPKSSARLPPPSDLPWLLGRGHLRPLGSLYLGGLVVILLTILIARAIRHFILNSEAPIAGS